MTTTGRKLPPEIRRQLTGLRGEWQRWKRGGPHPAYGLICPERCGQPGCEGCAATAYRADRMAEITARAKALTAAFAKPVI